MEQLTDIKWLGHASFMFTDMMSGKRIYYIDPFDLKEKNLQKADLIFITHAHYDHCSKEDVQKLITQDTTVIAPSDCLKNLAIPQNLQFPVLPNQTYNVKAFQFMTIPAYNTHPDRLQAHPKENKWVGYIFTINGKKIYHAGDTDFIPEMKTLAAMHLDIAMLPMGGKYTMDVSEMAKAANTIAATYTIPMHYKRLLGENYKEAEETLKKLVTKSEVRILSEVQ
ncbi:MAG: MBL fold metallo-hydrolase [Candidatus Levybacteria bacterium]|nr:MBL fold metallo-hydrolase [Candidatus Levybacteria bacterium]